nr:hypothetical protein [Tanacetum cinerariifolium]
EDQQWPVVQQRRPSARLLVRALVTGVEAPGHIVVDGMTVDEAHRNDTGQGHERHQIKHRDRPEQPGAAACQQRRASVTRMVPGLIAAGTPGERLGTG